MSKLKKYKKDSKYVSYMVVQVGELYSLIDMMRYDRCCPAEESESRKIQALGDHTATASDRLIRLIRYGATPDPAFARWKSFGASVLYVGSPDDGFPSDDVILGLLKYHVATGAMP